MNHMIWTIWYGPNDMDYMTWTIWYGSYGIDHMIWPIIWDHIPKCKYLFFQQRVFLIFLLIVRTQHVKKWSDYRWKGEDTNQKLLLSALDVFISLCNSEILFPTIRKYYIIYFNYLFTFIWEKRCHLSKNMPIKHSEPSGNGKYHQYEGEIRHNNKLFIIIMMSH